MKKGLSLMRTAMENKGRKTALFGGTFDPLHMGHLELIRQVHDLLDPDRMIVIPAGHPYFKEREGKKVTSADHRIGMLRAGLEELSFPVEISTIETDKDSFSYSIETVREIKKRDGKEVSKSTDYYFLCGSDVLFYIDQWYESKALMKEVILTVTQRGDDDPAVINAKKQELTEAFGARIVICPFKCDDISSTMIRNDVDGSKELLPAGTYRYIKEHRLYERHTDGSDNQQLT